MTDFIAGFNITVEEERQELENMINDLLEIEKKNNKNQELVTQYSSEYEVYQKDLDQIDIWAMDIEELLKKIRGKV